MAQTDLWLVFDQISYFSKISLCLGFFVLFHMNFLSPHFVDDGIECHKVDVFEMVEGLGCSLELFGRFPRVDALQNAHLSEVFERKLQFADGFSPADVFDNLSSFPSLYFPHNWIVDYKKV